MGWFTVVIYFLAAYFSFRAYLYLRNTNDQSSGSSQTIFWLAIVFILVVLGINKQLDLQSLFTQIARCASIKYGWYEDRRKWQILFIISLGIVFIATMLMIYVFYSDLFRQNYLAIAGLAILLSFIFLRASSFHLMDQFINYNILNIRMNWVLELLGPSLILIASIRSTQVPEWIWANDRYGYQYGCQVAQMWD